MNWGFVPVYFSGSLDELIEASNVLLRSEGETSQVYFESPDHPTEHNKAISRSDAVDYINADIRIRLAALTKGRFKIGDQTLILNNDNPVVKSGCCDIESLNHVTNSYPEIPRKALESGSWEGEGVREGYHIFRHVSKFNLQELIFIFNNLGDDLPTWLDTGEVEFESSKLFLKLWRENEHKKS